MIHASGRDLRVQYRPKSIGEDPALKVARPVMQPAAAGNLD